MPLHAPNSHSRERIMAFGGAGAGKSFNYYTIARLAMKTGSDSVFRVLDTDESAWRMLEDPAFAGILDEAGEPINIEITEAYNWQTFVDGLEKIHAVTQPQDWTLIDMLSPTWTWVQDHFTEKVFKQGMDDYFLQKRAAMRGDEKKVQMFEGWRDWPTINTMYGKLQEKILRWPGHLYVTSEQKAINTDQTEKDTKSLFGPHGVVPVGQKRNPHLFQTILWHREIRPGVREITTVKDRSRAQMAGTEITDFTMQYLVRTAGWKLA